MIGFLRIVGVLNASIWFGASIFFTFSVGPAFFSDSMLALLGRPHAGAAAQVVIERYFSLHQWCAIIALVYLISESLYLGRPVQRGILSLVLCVLVLGLIGGFGIQPKLKRLHVIMYGPAHTQVDRDRAAKSFRVWHATSSVLNLVVLGGVLVYLLNITKPATSSRYRASAF